MTKYRNIFKEKTEKELVKLYKQYLDFEKHGIVSEDTELNRIKTQYSEWFQDNSMEIVMRDLLHSISDFWFIGQKPYDNTTRYRYRIEFSGSEGSCMGTIVLTEEQARLVDYAMDEDHWDDFYCDMYSSGGEIDIDNPMEIGENDEF